MMIDWDVFVSGGFAVSFDTLKEYIEFMEACEEKGIYWLSGCKAIEYNDFGRCDKAAVRCVGGRLSCESVEYYLTNEIPVYKACDIGEVTCDIYRENIITLMDRQKEKGLRKYGEILEDNTTLSRVQRIEHLEEELIDGLQYCEHLKMTLCDSLSANDYQRMAMRTAGDKTENYLDNAIMGLCGEVGECADIVKKHHFQGHDLDREKLKDELSDVCWYVALLATALDLTLEEVMIHNVEKLKKRYPDGFDKSRSIHRDEIAN